MSDETRAKPPQLTLEQLADLLPGTGEIMASVGVAWWKCVYAARGGNWELAAYFARRVRGLQRKLAVIRPKYADDLGAFEAELLAPGLASLERHDGPAIERLYAKATDNAHELHVKWAEPDTPSAPPTEPPELPDISSGGPGRWRARGGPATS